MKLTCDNVFPELWDYLTEHVTPERKLRFEEVVSMRTRHLSVVVEDIFQPHNASAVLRTCECYGIQDVHIIENKNQYQINPDVVIGSANWISLHRWNEKQHNTEDCLLHLINSGYQIVATSLNEEAISLPDFIPQKKTALIFGNEVEGISDIVKAHADFFLRIPMYGFTESFNISVSAAICLSKLCEVLKNSSINWQLSEHEQRTLLLEWICKHLKNADVIIDRFLKKNQTAQH